MDPLASLSPVTRDWFERAFAGPTPAQRQAVADWFAAQGQAGAQAFHHSEMSR